MVGTAYRRPSPDAKAFIEVGSQVKAGEKSGEVRVRMPYRFAPGDEE
jgi:hypothetical protein